MSKFDARLSLGFLRDLQVQTRHACAEKPVDAASQAFMSLLCTTFLPSLVMARLYGTLPHASLPPDVAIAAARKAEQRGASLPIPSSTPVWTLLGTHGIEPDWTDRRKSKQHAAIPLLSQAFVETFPMVARLFKDMGIGLQVEGSNKDQIVLGQILGANATRFFYVGDAATALDHIGRRIIPGQEFVSKYDVRTVFGFGGQFANGMLVAVILFWNESIPESVARRLAPVVSVFRATATRAIFAGQLFDTQG